MCDKSKQDITPVYDVTKHGITSVYDVTKHDITSVYDVTKHDITSVYDVTKHGITSVYDVTKHGITSVCDVTKHGITSMQLTLTVSSSGRVCCGIARDAVSGSGLARPVRAYLQVSLPRPSLRLHRELLRIRPAGIRRGASVQGAMSSPRRNLLYLVHG